MRRVGAGDVTLAVRETAGPSAPVLLIHGFPLGGASWDGQVASLGDRLRLVVPDLKGYGGSDAPADPAAYSIDGFADELVRLLDALGHERVVACGLSMGGYVALALARRHPSRLRGLALVDTRAEADDDAGKKKRAAQQDEIAASGTGGLAAKLAVALLGETTRRERPELVERVKALLVTQPPAGWRGSLEAMKTRPDARPDLARIQVPALIVVGAEDTVTPPELSWRLHAAIDGSRLVVIPRAGHLVNLEAPAAFEAVLTDFVLGL